jgi:hypothetical protein
MASANLARFYATKEPQKWTSLLAVEHLDILPTEQRYRRIGSSTFTCIAVCNVWRSVIRKVI